MLRGTATLDELSAGAPTIPTWHEAPLVFPDVTVFQVSFEMRNSAREAVLPAGLHPTVPAAMTLQAYDVKDSSLGAFRWLVCRVSCRSGVRARGYTTMSLIDNAEAGAAISSTLGYPTYAASIAMDVSYLGCEISAAMDDYDVLSVTAIDPDPLGNDDVQYTGTLNLAHTPLGLRLVQVEQQHELNRVERLQARLHNFDGTAFGQRLLEPSHLITATIASGSITFPPVRFVCQPEELAFTGTEPVA